MQVRVSFLQELHYSLMNSNEQAPLHPSQKVSIKDPCPESYAGMASTKAGAWCSKCTHQVVDYRGKSNQEILDALKAGGKTCGVFNTSQLASPTIPTLSLWQKSRRVAALSFALLGFQIAVSAQTQMDPKPEKYPEKVCPVEDGPGHIESPSKVHWWQFRKKRRQHRNMRMGFFGIDFFTT